MSQDSETITSDSPLGGRYNVIKELGAGGFGQTFLAEDLHLPGCPQCVVKQLKPQTSDVNALQMARRLFDTEAQDLYQLGNHNQIPRLLAHFEEHEEFYLVQEYVEGEPLTQELGADRRWSEGQTIALLQDLLQILAFVHQQNVIHRDIKPPNLIRRRCDGRIVLIDFGAVKQVSTQTLNPETGETNITISIGTKGYMPNEQLAGNPRFSSDVYAVGLLGIQALTGIHPKRFKEDLLTGEINWRDHVTEISPDFAEILDTMVRYDFRDRYPTAVEALDALQRLPIAEHELLPSLHQTPKTIAEAPNGSTSWTQRSSVPTEELEESEINLESTRIWVAANPPERIGTNGSSVEPTATLPPREPPQPLSNAPSRRSSTQRNLVGLWSIPVVLSILGAAFGIAQIVPLSQLARQTANQSNVPAASPSPSPVSKPSPPPKPTAASLLRQANRQRDTGQYQKALELYDQAIERKPDFAEAYWGRCYSLNKLKKPAEAVVACNDALDLKSNYPEALWSKGNAYEQQKLILEALRLYERATRLKPNLAEAWIDYGAALQSVGRAEEAIKALDKGITFNRDSARAWTTKGKALWYLGRVEKAIAALDKALQIQPDYPDAIKMRKKIRERLGR